MNISVAINKQDIAASFSRAAVTYDSVADLQRQVGHRLLSLIPVAGYPEIMDLGCGTGYFTRRLVSEFAAAVTGMDIAFGMLDFARAHESAAGIDWCCGDAESLPLAGASQSLIFSNLALQWCGGLQRTLSEAWRVLKPGGCFAFSTLGPGTLHELRDAWSQVDRFTHVNRFAEPAVIRDEVDHAGFSCRLVSEQIVMGYRSVRELTHELKMLGAHNLNPGRAVGLTGKGRIRAMLQAYEAYRDQSGKLPATYQVFYFILHKES